MTIVTVLNGAGRLKNSRGALRAFELVKQEIPDSRLVMTGSGHDLGGEVAAWARHNQLSSGVEFRGPIAHGNLLALLSEEADVLLHPALSEACSVTVLEAMSLGVPVIAGEASGGIPWQLANGGAGQLTDVTSPAAMADATIRLLRSPAERIRLSAAAGELIAHVFAYEKGLDRYEEWFARGSQV